MSAFKNLLKSDTPTGNPDRTTGLGGQGSHFRKDDETSFSKTAEQATVTRNEPQISGSPDISAAPASAAQAYNIAGPKAGGQEHADTTSRSGGQALSGQTSEQKLQSASQPVSNHPSVMSTSGTNQGSSRDSPPPPRFEEGSGTAAISQTTTYSSRPLASGDPTGSIVDHESADPMTYKLPEAASHTSTTPATKGANETGVTSSAPLAAASTAWASHNQGQRMPGEFPTPGHENPYKTSSLDPRVDGGKPRQSGEATNLSSQGDTKKDLTGTSGAAGVGAGAAAAGASQAFNGSSAPGHSTTETAPSSLKTTADPETRSGEYGQSTAPRELDSATAPTTTSTTSAQPGATSTASTHPQTGDENQGIMSKMLGAVGLGGAGAAAASALGYGGKTEGQDELRDTSAGASQPGQTSQETGPPKHYRRESIPTTAYPAGPSSPRAVAPPVGGAQVPATHGHSQATHVGKDAALGAGVGGGAIAASRLDDPQGHRQDITGEPGSTTHPISGLEQGNAGSSVPPSGDSHGPGFRDNTVPAPRSSNTQPQTRSTVHDLITTGSPQDDSHSGRNTGLAATAVAAGAGAGAYGLHEHNKDRGTSSTTQPSTFTDSTGYPDRSRDTAVPSTATGPTVFPDRTRGTPIDALAAAPGRYDGQDARTYPSSTTNAPVHEQERAREEDHTGRNAALGAGAGAAAGGAAYAAHNDSKEEEAARRAAAEREKASAKQREAQEKDAAKERKEHEKDLERQHKHDQKEREKEEKQHEKELGKQHKHDQKEREKEEKQHQKELEKQHKHEEQQHAKDEKERAAAAAAAEKREKARLASEEEDRMRREREAQAGIAAGSIGTAGAVAGTGMFGHEKDRATGTVGPTGQATGVSQRAHHDNIHDRDQHAAAHEQAHSSHDGKHTHEKHTHEEKEKKPSFFKRIFKRRKNKDTGVDEEYSSDEEDLSHGQHGTAATAAGSAVPTHHSDVKGRNVLGSSPGNTGLTSTDNRDPTTGLAYDQTKDPQAADRLSHEPGTATGVNTGTGTGHNTYTIGRGTDAAPLGAGSASGISGQSAAHQHESSSHGTTGVPHDASRGTTGATGLDSTTGTHGASSTGYGHPSSATERLGEIGEHHR